MNEMLHALQNRNSAPRLCGPAPSRDELKEMIRAAIRAPDHAWLRPWRFLAIEGHRREALGHILENGLITRDPLAGDMARNKASRAPLRAPLILVAIARLIEHPKVPESEQRLSAACATHSVLLAAEALGYAGMWRTGGSSFDRTVMADLGLSNNEEIVGFLYLGTRDGPSKAIPDLDPEHFLSDW
ncbi:MAG: nitroreductase [Halioglobus sp.]|jgi:nitroreductase